MDVIGDSRSIFLYWSEKMRIKKILNNNVVITEQSDGSEMIVRGKGLAFQKKRGDEIQPQDIEKTYVLNDQPELFQKLQSILANIDSVYLDITDQVVKWAEEADIQLSQMIYLNLPDHLSASVSRIKEGVVLRNSLLGDVRRFYPKEFQIAQQTLILVEEKVGEILPQDEAGFIAAHIINASLDVKRPVADAVIEILNAIKALLDEEGIISVDENSVYYDRFMTHLKYFAQRIVQHEASGDEEDDLFTMIVAKYPQAAAIADKITAMIENQYQYKVTSEERMYLTIHLAKLLKNQSL